MNVNDAGLAVATPDPLLVTLTVTVSGPVLPIAGGTANFMSYVTRVPFNYFFIGSVGDAIYLRAGLFGYP